MFINIQYKVPVVAFHSKNNEMECPHRYSVISPHRWKHVRVAAYMLNTNAKLFLVSQFYITFEIRFIQTFLLRPLVKSTTYFAHLLTHSIDNASVYMCNHGCFQRKAYRLILFSDHLYISKKIFFAL